MDDLKTVQALVLQMRSALGHSDNIAIADQALALIAQMQRDTVQPDYEDCAALDDLRRAVAFFDQMKEAAAAGEDVTRTGIARDAREWLERAARAVAAPQPAPEPQQDQLQQPDGHSTRASGVCASTAPLPLFAVGVAQRKWESLQADGYRMQRIEFARSIDGQETRGIIDPWGRVLWKHEQDDHAGSPGLSPVPDEDDLGVMKAMEEAGKAREATAQALDKANREKK